MQRKLGSTLFAAVLTAIVLLWLASDPPPGRNPGARASIARDETPAAGGDVDAEVRSEVAEPSSDDSIAIEPAEATEATETPAPTSWTKECAPGTVEVLVLLDREPHAGASVRLIHEQPSTQSLELPTDARGLALFGPFDGAISATVEAALEPDVLATAYVRWAAGEPTERVVIHLSRGGIEGHVYGSDGLPIAGVQMQIECMPRDAGQDWLRRVETSSEGAYRVAGVPRGISSVFAEMPGEEISRRIDVVLEGGEWKRVDFGSAEAPVRLSGRLLLGSGAVVTGLDQITLTSPSGEERVVPCNERGEFSVELAPGPYIASVWTVSHETTIVGLAVGADGLVRDLVVAGIELHGQVTYSGTWPEPARVESTVQVWIENVDTGRKHLANRPGSRSRYAFVGLEPGKYRVTTWDQPLLGAGDKGVEIQLDGARDSVALDLTVTDPH